MGLMGLLRAVFGGGRNVVVETAGAFVPNAEATAQRAAQERVSAREQFAAEQYGRGWFDALVSGINRLPRPILAFGTIGLFVFAMADPVAFAARMQGMVLVPDQLWWLLGAIVSFYFGARELQKTRETRVAATLAAVPQVVENIRQIRAINADTPGVADPGEDSETLIEAVKPDRNRAIDDWRGDP